MAGLLAQGGRRRAARHPAQRARHPAGRPATPAPAAQAAAPATAGGYVVQRGDTLSTIATRLHVAGGWQDIVAKNPGMGNPNLIHVGQQLTV